MQDRQTKTIVQVCKGADQIEKAPGPSKTHLLLGGGGKPAWARKKNEKYYELRDGRHRRQGQDRELYPILPLNREVLHCNTPPTPKRSNQKKRNTQTAGKKKKCSPQKRSADALSTIFSWSSTHRRIADILSFPPRARPPLMSGKKRPTFRNIYNIYKMFTIRHKMRNFMLYFKHFLTFVYICLILKM
jgi:hypothetical protein